MNLTILNNEKDYEDNLKVEEKQQFDYYFQKFMEYMQKQNEEYVPTGFNFFLEYYDLKAKKQYLTELLLPWFCLNDSYYVLYINTHDDELYLPSYFIMPTKFMLRFLPGGTGFASWVCHKLRDTYRVVYGWQYQYLASSKIIQQNILLVDKKADYTKI